MLEILLKTNNTRDNDLCEKQALFSKSQINQLKYETVMKKLILKLTKTIQKSNANYENKLNSPKPIKIIENINHVKIVNFKFLQRYSFFNKENI